MTRQLEGTRETSLSRAKRSTKKISLLTTMVPLISSPASPSSTLPRIPVEVDATSSDRDRQKIPSVAPMCLRNDLDVHMLQSDRATPADVIMEQPMSMDDETTVAIIQDHPKVHASTNISVTPDEGKTE